MIKEKMAATQDLMVEYLDLKTPLDVDCFYTNEFLT
jgi:hypothetical protein